MQRKKGISLIVLVITIIVMIVLAGAIILTLNNSGIISKANEAVDEMNEDTVREMASLAWAEAYADGVRTVEDVEGKEGFESRVLAALSKVDTTKYNIKITTSGVEVTKKGDAEEGIDLNPSGIIPEGAKYITADGTTYNAGDNFPTTLNALDRYETDDYTYVYQANWAAEPNAETVFETQFREDASYDGWLVTTFGKTKKTTYGAILESINGKNVTNMSNTFRNNGVIEVAPLIPKNINEVFAVFYQCANLKELSEGFTIPSGITKCSEMFALCTSLQTIPTSFVIHENITEIISMFVMCNNLKGTINIDANPTNYRDFLYGCDTTQITLSGKSTMKTELLATAEN